MGMSRWSRVGGAKTEKGLKRVTDCREDVGTLSERRKGNQDISRHLPTQSG